MIDTSNRVGFFHKCSEQGLSITYDDIFIKPRKSDLSSRDEVSLRNSVCDELGVEAPVFSAPMVSVTDICMLEALVENGFSGVLHRFGKHYSNPIKTVKMEDSVGRLMLDKAFVSVSLSDASDYELIHTLLKYQGNICIDTAYGNNEDVLEVIGALKSRYGDHINVMAGNICTRDGAQAMKDVGADFVRVGIGGGSACSTRRETGHGMPNATAIYECNRILSEDRKPYLVADGGIRNSGDMVKAFACGADAVMCGSIFAKTDLAPNEGKHIGSASDKVKGSGSYVEGVEHEFDEENCQKLEDVIADIKDGIRSGLSYSGVRTISEFKSKVQLGRQTFAGFQEGNPHF